MKYSVFLVAWRKVNSEVVMTITPKVLTPAIILLQLGSLGCQRKEMEIERPGSKKVSAIMEGKSGHKVSGNIEIKEKDGQIVFETHLKNVTPNTLHALHVHQSADCSAADASSAGPHFSPDDRNHGIPHEEASHAGDLGNFSADENGEINATIVADRLTLSPGKEHSLQGRAIVLHAGLDDFKTSPGGDAGERIGCAPIYAQGE